MANVPKSLEGFRVPHANKLEMYCPIAKPGGCEHYNKPKLAYCENMIECDLDESLDKGYMVFEEDFRHEKGEGTKDVIEFHKWIQEQIDKEVVATLKVQKNDYLTLIGVDATPRLTTINMKFVCPLFVKQAPTMVSISDKEFEKVIDASKLDETNEKLRWETYEPFIGRLTTFINKRYPTWQHLKSL